MFRMQASLVWIYSISFLLYSPCTNKTTGNRLQDYSWVLFFLVYDKGVISFTWNNIKENDRNKMVS